MSHHTRDLSKHLIKGQVHIRRQVILTDVDCVNCLSESFAIDRWPLT
uniref:Uncharacterized protein n=1 Tax=Arundo donax TaxID=35708 RepID=A0A0A9G8W6_ARUDO